MIVDIILFVLVALIILNNYIMYRWNKKLHKLMAEGIKMLMDRNKERE